jgi:hypothetical protein
MVTVRILYFFSGSSIIVISLRHVQLSARFGPTPFTTCMPRSSMPTTGPRNMTRTLPYWRGMSSFSTSSLTLCFSNHATLLVSFSPCCRTRLCFHMCTQTRNGQSFKPRDAWIQANGIRHNSSNRCFLSATFTSRGLGVNATDYNDDTSIPLEFHDTKEDDGPLAVAIRKTHNKLC